MFADSDHIIILHFLHLCLMIHILYFLVDNKQKFQFLREVLFFKTLLLTLFTINQNVLVRFNIVDIEWQGTYD